MVPADQRDVGVRENPLVGWFLVANAALAVLAICAWWVLELGPAICLALAWGALICTGSALYGRRALWAILFAPVILFLPAMMILIDVACGRGGCDF